MVKVIGLMTLSPQFFDTFSGLTVVLDLKL